jgi:hypothetical protein
VFGKTRTVMDNVSQKEVDTSFLLGNDKAHVLYQLLTERTRKQTNCVKTLI